MRFWVWNCLVSVLWSCSCLADACFTGGPGCGYGGDLKVTQQGARGCSVFWDLLGAEMQGVWTKELRPEAVDLGRGPWPEENLQSGEGWGPNGAQVWQTRHRTRVQPSVGITCSGQTPEPVVLASGVEGGIFAHAMHTCACMQLKKARFFCFVFFPVTIRNKGNSCSLSDLLLMLCLELDTEPF